MLMRAAGFRLSGRSASLLPPLCSASFPDGLPAIDSLRVPIRLFCRVLTFHPPLFSQHHDDRTKEPRSEKERGSVFASCYAGSVTSLR